LSNNPSSIQQSALGIQPVEFGFLTDDSWRVRSDKNRALAAYL
jgi:hypothetical protein